MAVTHQRPKQPIKVVVVSPVVVTPPVTVAQTPSLTAGPKSSSLTVFISTGGNDNFN